MVFAVGLVVGNGEGVRGSAIAREESPRLNTKKLHGLPCGGGRRTTARPRLGHGFFRTVWNRRRLVQVVIGRDEVVWRNKEGVCGTIVYHDLPAEVIIQPGDRGYCNVRLRAAALMSRTAGVHRLRGTVVPHGAHV